MKNKKLFFKIYIPFAIIVILFLVILQILGSKKRIGYLTDFNFNINQTLELNNLNYIIKDFVTDSGLDEESIKNYLLTNENITNYAHHFRIRYYDKVFRNSDIYGVYLNLNNLPDFIKEIKIDEGGSPYGNFISDKKFIEIENIDNVNYILKLKNNILYGVLFSLIIFLILYLYIIQIIINNKIYAILFIINILLYYLIHFILSKFSILTFRYNTFDIIFFLHIFNNSFQFIK